MNLNFNMQQFGFVIGYVSQDLIPQRGKEKEPYMFFGVTTRKQNGSPVYVRCRVVGELVEQFASQHSKGSIVALFGDIYHQYDGGAKNRVNNLFNVISWFYFADIDAHFDDLNNEEFEFLTYYLRSFREMLPAKRDKLLEKIRK